MIINSADGQAVSVTGDGRMKTLAANEPFLHALSEVGRAWTLPFIQTGAANTTDNVVFHFKNTSDTTMDFHKVLVSSAEVGLWSVYYGRTYTSGGTVLSLAQLNVTSGQTQTMTAYYGTAIVLAGTATLLSSGRTLANTMTDILNNTECLQVPSGGTLEIRFQAAAGSNQMAVNIYCHGKEPWE